MDNVQNMDYWMQHAVNRIAKDYGDRVSVFEKGKDLLKFGRTTECQTSLTTVMSHKTGIYNETYVATNAIDKISSSSGSDTEQIVLEGHTIDASGNFTFVTQTVTLAGQTETAITTPLARATRAYANGSTDLVGTIYVYEDDTVVAGVPSTGTKVHLTIPAGKNQSEKCATTLSSQDYWIITNVDGHCLEKTAAFADFHLEIREKGKVFRDIYDWSAESGTGFSEQFYPYIIVPKNADVRVRATASAADKEVSASVHGVLAIVT